VSLILDIELWMLLKNKPELRLKMMMNNYMALATLGFSKFSDKSSKEEIEKYVNDIFFEVFNYNNGADSQKEFIKVFLTSIAKRKIIDDIYRRNRENNQTSMNNASMHLNTLGEDVIRSILLKGDSSELIEDMRSLNEPDSHMITRNYCLNQSIKDISNNTGLKVSTYAYLFKMIGYYI
jgi:RNA polymerase sigma-70 factor (ECF subfamily)